MSDTLNVPLSNFVALQPFDFEGLDQTMQELESRGTAPTPPVTSAVLGCLCCGSAYRYSGTDIYRGVPTRDTCRRRSQSKEDGAFLISACLIAAIRLAREEKWDNSLRVASRIADSVELARRVWERWDISFIIHLLSYEKDRYIATRVERKLCE
jgi:hypothetical protein